MRVQNNVTKTRHFSSGKVFEITESDFYNVIENEARPVLVDFWADWCEPCAFQAEILDKLAKLAGDAILILKIHVDDAKSLGRKYEIYNIPTLLLFNNGQREATLIGVQSLKELLLTIKPCVDEVIKKSEIKLA